MMNVEMAMESRLACVPLGSAPAFSQRLNLDTTHRYEGGVQDIDVSPPNTIAVKLFKFPAVHGEEAGAWVIGQDILQLRMSQVHG